MLLPRQGSLPLSQAHKRCREWASTQGRSREVSSSPSRGAEGPALPEVISGLHPTSPTLAAVRNLCLLGKPPEELQGNRPGLHLALSKGLRTLWGLGLLLTRLQPVRVAPTVEGARPLPLLSIALEVKVKVHPEQHGWESGGADVQ